MISRSASRRRRRTCSITCVIAPANIARRVDAALDEPLVPRRFRQSIQHQHSREPCEWRTRWQMSSPSSRRPIPHGGLSRGYEQLMALEIEFRQSGMIYGCPSSRHDDLAISCAMLVWAAQHPHLGYWTRALEAPRSLRKRQAPSAAGWT